MEYRQRAAPRAARPLSLVQTGDAGPSSQMSLPPPPPLPPGGPVSRSPSQNRLDVHRDQPSYGVRPGPSIMVSQDGLKSPAAASHGYMDPTSPPDNNLARPPTSRRAVSAGPVVGSASSSRAASKSPSRSPPIRGWEPGMPLPPPPPGPPPTARSHSVSGSPESSSARHMKAPVKTRARPPPSLGTGLDSIPPTPAGWVDEGSSQAPHSHDQESTTVQTVTVAKSPGNSGPSTPNSGNLFRSPALRDVSAKGIRERRVERRNRQGQALEDLNAPDGDWGDNLDQVKPSNLILAGPNGTPRDNHAPTSAKYTPRSGHSTESDGPQSGTRSRASSIGLFSSRSSYSTPRAEPSPAVPTRGGYTRTPPFSPDAQNPSPAYPKAIPQALPTKALPTPPLQSVQEGKPPSRPSSRGERQIPRGMNLSNDPMSVEAPLAPHGASSQQKPLPNSSKNEADEFLRESFQRHKVFIEKEASAVNETDAINIFAEFIIAESQIRRQRCGQAWDSGSFDPEEVRRKLFELPPPQPAPLGHYAINGRRTASPFRQPSAGPKLDMSHTNRPEPSWGNTYKPSLSPIASLSMSNDEMSSRGRAHSRWWESKTGSSSEGGERRVQRSKQESKYMGLPREALQEPHTDYSRGKEAEPYSGDYSTGQYTPYGPDEYPPEKVGWHGEPAPPSDPDTAGYGFVGRFQEDPKMDVSRLITLPPPYPRHYPAVNNSHPDLVSYRTLVRSISDLSEIKSMRQRHDSEVDHMLQGHRERIQDSRRQFKDNIQCQIQHGSISFAEAAEAEAALVLEENKVDRTLTKKELDLYQTSVLDPARAILTDRISRATGCIDELSSKLFDDARHETPDQTQEEGDEKPELLEKLTQLKWLFETREVLHREKYDLVHVRNEKYRTVVLLPYRQKANGDKVRETNAFFDQDALDRRAQYEADALARLESFMDVIEENVVRGVEVQLSAFWDIAPSLLVLIQQIPPDLCGFEVQIPADEYDENPSYRRHPLQYLYSLLSHAGKSSYQYIESQTNLFCLLHEVKSAVMRANCKLMEAERIRHGEPEDEVRREMQDLRAGEERALTVDLKDKVATVECQWTEALGSQIQELQERVKTQLVTEDGWEELEQLEQA